MKKITFILGFVAIVAVCSQQVYSLPSTDGLVGYWQFNGDGTDASGNSHTGQTYGTATYVDSDFDQSLYMTNSLASYFLVGYHPDFNFTTSYTASMWIKPEGTTGALFNKWIGWGPDDYIIYLSAGTLLPVMFTSTGRHQAYIEDYELGLQLNEWQQIVVTYDAAATEAKIYRNGTLLYGFYASGSVTTHAVDLYMGITPMSGGGWTYQYQGYMDEARLYDRALTLAEIEEEYFFTLNGGDTATTVPEPATAVLMLVAAGALKLVRRR